MPRSDASDRIPPANQLLAALPVHEYERLRPFLEPAPLVLKTLLSEAGDPISHVYFPGSGVLSLLSPPEGRGGVGTELGMVGREGMTGLAVFLGMDTTPMRCIVQLSGDALRMNAGHFRQLVAHDCFLHRLLLRYTHAFLAQVSQSLACLSLHPVEKRLCRWLLMMHCRAEADQFPLTHQFMAAMLGVRRATVSVAARRLQDAGLIRCNRGQVTVLDKPGLEGVACRCHRVVQEVLERLHK